MSEPNLKLSQAAFAALPWLHIYAQPLWHSPAKIIGTRAALRGLADAIERALATGQSAVANAIAADGEGYEVVVDIRSYQSMLRDDLPYIDPIARSEGER